MNLKSKEEKFREAITLNRNCKNTFMKLVKKVYIYKTLCFELKYNTKFEEYEEKIRKRDSYLKSIALMLMFLSSQYYHKYEEHILDKKINPNNIAEMSEIINEYQLYIEKMYNE